ncbi:MAG: outer membrane protein assembly factor BamD [Proteobacteria bacterium]|nr:outer membrane protein assembly factor BamD [Pseudomonadota bacterium]
MKIKMNNKLFCIVFCAVLSACASTPEEPKIAPVDELYNSGMDLLEAGKYAKAVTQFEELERQHPYSGWATRGQMMMAYAQFRMGDYDESLASVEQFIRLHPGHPNLDYMYYLRGLNGYYRIRDVNRDQAFTLEALHAFEELARRFPTSKYSSDAKLKITLCRDHIAGQEMNIGRYYQQNNQHLAAVNRFRNVVDNYQKTAQAAEALFRLTESYLALGLEEDAKRSAAILGYNYPDSIWYRDAYDLMLGKHLVTEDERKSWAGKFVKGVEDLF